ncbi:hypothetical protein BJX66DRAFT_320139, partial [Aspergillus keveii]
RVESRGQLFSHPYYTPLVLARDLLRICKSAAGFRWSWRSIAQPSSLYTRIWEALPRSGGYLNMEGDPRKSVKWIDGLRGVASILVVTHLSPDEAFPG